MLPDSVILKQMLVYIESNQDSNASNQGSSCHNLELDRYNINGLCSKFKLKRRSLYDFVSICSVFGGCRKLSSDEFIWCGTKDLGKTLDRIKEEAQDQLNNFEKTNKNEHSHNSFIELFNCSKNSSLVHITRKILELFLLLNTKLLDLRQVASFFASGVMKYKTMLRKVYSVASAMETARVIARTSKVAEIRLLPYQEVQNNSKLGIGAILNTKEELREANVYDQRKRIYLQFFFSRENDHNINFWDAPACPLYLQQINC